MFLRVCVHLFWYLSCLSVPERACSTYGCVHMLTPLWCLCVLTDSLSAQRAHTHGRRVRHSSSDSSGSDSTGESRSSSQHSQSSSPEAHPDPVSPTNTQPPYTKEVPFLFVFPVRVLAVTVFLGFLGFGLVVCRRRGRRWQVGGGTEECVCVERGVEEVALGIRTRVSCQQDLKEESPRGAEVIEIPVHDDISSSISITFTSSTLEAASYTECERHSVR